MPIAAVNITRTNPKDGTYQFSDGRQSGLILKLQSGVTSVTNRRIVSIQEDTLGNRYAVPGGKALVLDPYTTLKIVGYGVLEEALQSGGLASIAPTPNNFVDGDIVTVLNDLTNVYQIDYDTGQTIPTIGIATARVNNSGQLTSVGADSNNIQLGGSVFISVPGTQMKGQLLTGCLFFKMKDSVVA